MVLTNPLLIRNDPTIERDVRISTLKMIAAKSKAKEARFVVRPDGKVNAADGYYHTHGSIEQFKENHLVKGHIKHHGNNEYSYWTYNEEKHPFTEKLEDCGVKRREKVDDDR